MFRKIECAVVCRMGWSRFALADNEDLTDAGAIYLCEKSQTIEFVHPAKNFPISGLRDDSRSCLADRCADQPRR